MAAKTPLHKVNVPDPSRPFFHSVATVQKAVCLPAWAAEQGVKWEKKKQQLVFHTMCAVCFRRQEALCGDAEQTTDGGGCLSPVRALRSHRGVHCAKRS